MLYLLPEIERGVFRLGAGPKSASVRQWASIIPRSRLRFGRPLAAQGNDNSGRNDENFEEFEDEEDFEELEFEPAFQPRQRTRLATQVITIPRRVDLYFAGINFCCNDADS